VPRPRGLGVTFISREVAQRLGVPKSVAKVFVEEIFVCLKDILETGESVTIQEFGKFYIKDIEGYTNKHPKTGQKQFVPPYRILKFKPSPKSVWRKT